MSRFREYRKDEVITRVIVDRRSGRVAEWWWWPPTEEDPRDLSGWVFSSRRLRYGGPLFLVDEAAVRRYLVHGDLPQR